MTVKLQTMLKSESKTTNLQMPAALIALSLGCSLLIGCGADPEAEELQISTTEQSALSTEAGCEDLIQECGMLRCGPNETTRYYALRDSRCQSRADLDADYRCYCCDDTSIRVVPVLY